MKKILLIILIISIPGFSGERKEMRFVSKMYQLLSAQLSKSTVKGQPAFFHLVAFHQLDENIIGKKSSLISICIIEEKKTIEISYCNDVNSGDDPNSIFKKMKKISFDSNEFDQINAKKIEIIPNSSSVFSEGGGFYWLIMESKRYQEESFIKLSKWGGDPNSVTTWVQMIETKILDYNRSTGQ